MMNENIPVVKYNIDKIETTDEILSGRAGLTLITRYLRSIEILNLLSKVFSFLKSSKGSTLISIFNQIICFFFDGTKFRFNRFDQLNATLNWGSKAFLEVPCPCLVDVVLPSRTADCIYLSSGASTPGVQLLFLARSTFICANIRVCTKHR